MGDLDGLVMAAEPPPAIVRAAWADPLDATLLLALADYFDEQGGPLDALEAVRWRVIAEPHEDRWRLAYADVLDGLGSDYRPHADVIRVMCSHPDWFEPKSWNDSWRNQSGLGFAAAVATVSTNLDLIAWADLDLQTGPVHGSYVWNRVQAETDAEAGTEGPVHVSFRRGFVCEVRARLGSLLGRACSLWRHPVEGPHCLDRLPWRGQAGSAWGWFDANLIDGSPDDPSRLPTELMRAMAGDENRADRHVAIRFERGKPDVGGCCLFECREHAEQALRRALTVHGRRQALCPPD